MNQTLPRMKKHFGTLPLILMGFALLIAVNMLPQRALAQWQKMVQFDQLCDCGFFLDENTGLVGTGIRSQAWLPAEIFRTTDGGITWTNAVVPFLDSAGVTSILMVDPKIGYATVSVSIFKGGGYACLWK